jgi:LmbE family N-acetylglucosaminyl deacetylase
MRVLAIGTHPDDLEILCGGTLARYVADGHEVVMAHATDGARGGLPGEDPLAVAGLRAAEAAEAALLAGAEHVSVGLPDGGVSPADAEQRRAIVELVREAAPDVILTHHPEDYHGDHRDVSELVFTASFAAANPLVEGRGDAPARVPALVYIDTLAGLGFEPTDWVDITAHVEVKRAMLSAHESQVVALRETFGVDILDQIEVCARYRGLQAAVRYGEAFQICRSWHRVRPGRLLP